MGELPSYVADKLPHHVLYKQPPHSRIAIVAAVIGGFALVLFVTAFVVLFSAGAMAGVEAQKTGIPSQPSEALVMIGGLTFLMSAGISFVGLIISGIGMSKKEGARTIFATAGLVLNALVFVGWLLLTVIGASMR